MISASVFILFLYEQCFLLLLLGNAYLFWIDPHQVLGVFESEHDKSFMFCRISWQVIVPFLVALSVHCSLVFSHVASPAVHGLWLIYSLQRSPSRVTVSRCGLAVVSKRTSVRSSSAVLSLQKLWFMDTVLWLCPHNTRNIKMAHTTAHLNAESILVMTV